jgi:AcrR family transcriptional regulator
VISHADRRARTRQALLDAAAALFAELGVEGAPVDAIASSAGRTAGALYDHFGSKEGLLFALVEEWMDDNAAETTADLAAATTFDERLAALWRGTSATTAGGGGWLTLEHELWAYAQRHDAVRERLTHRYRELWAGIDALADVWPDLEVLRGKGPVVMGVLTGLEMMRRVDPAAVTDEAAIEALRGAIGARPSEGKPT